MTLTDFLLARIAADEAAVNRLIGAIFGEPGLRPDVARMLRECEAKRRIVERLRGDAPGGPGGQIGWDYLDPTLLDLAAVYADHPDYRDEWKP